MKRKDLFRELSGILLLQYQCEPGGSVFNARPVSIFGANQPSTEGTLVKSKNKIRELGVIRRSITVAAALICLAAANLVSTAAQATDLVVYATVQNHVAVIDMSNPELPVVCATIDSGVSPTAHSVTVSPDGTQLYVANQGGSMSVMDRATNTVVTEVSISGQPLHVAASPDGMYAYVTGQGGQIWFVDLSANLVSNTIENFINGFPYRPGITTNATGTLAYTGAYSSNNLDIVDTATQTVTGSIATNVAAPLYSAFSPDGKLLYTGGNQTFIYSVDHYIGRVAVIDTDPSSGTYHTQIATVDINTIPPYGPGAPQPTDLAFTPDGKELWVPTQGFYTIAVIDTDPASPTYNTEIATVASTQQPQVIKFSPDGTLAFIGHASSSQMRIVDVATRTTLANLPLGGTVWDLAVTTTSGLSCGAPEVTDSDGDGVDDGADLCPLTDAGAIVDASGCTDDDVDMDGDGICDSSAPSSGPSGCTGSDNCPLDANNGQEDADADGAGDACDSDDDNDGVPDGSDNCPLTLGGNTDQTDTDMDGAGDICDADLDGDGVGNMDDVCPNDPDPDQTDTDMDGDGDACDSNDDGDDFDDVADNCPLDVNNGQEDLDGDNIGDACDADLDGDGVDNDNDNCPVTLGGDGNQTDTDTDGQGDVCDDDDDNDTILDGDDNCPLAANPSQGDADGDGVGDACNDADDADGDDWSDLLDNCPNDANGDQADLDGDGIGDACDADIDGDGVDNAVDDCAATPLGELSDASGCTIAQLCPCDGPRGTTKPWKNHGKYVSCVAHAASDFRDAGLITGDERGDIVSAAGQSDCGR